MREEEIARGEDMSCTEHQRSFREESDAWAAWRNLRDSGNRDERELGRLQDNAADASTRVRLHWANCTECGGR